MLWCLLQICQEIADVEDWCPFVNIFHTYHFSKFVEEKRVFNEIEYYLPQLAHLVIHLDSDCISQSLERLLVILCQTSIHTALQLCFMLTAAMEDYQPENADGKTNPNANVDLYFRCARLLHNLECAVVFGSSTLTALESSQLAHLVPGTDLRASEKIERANEILRMSEKSRTSMENFRSTNGINKGSPEDSMAGFLFYKREFKKSLLVSKAWKNRYFRVHDKILLCYRNEGSKVLLRSIPIHDFEVYSVKREKHSFQFELRCQGSGLKYQLRATDQITYNYWIQGLKRCDTCIDKCF